MEVKERIKMSAICRLIRENANAYEDNLLCQFFAA